MKIKHSQAFWMTAVTLLVSLAALTGLTASPAKAFVELKDMQFLTKVVQQDEQGLRNDIAGGANVNAQDLGGNNALHYAMCSNAPMSTVKMLLQAGTDPNAKNNEGFAPLVYYVSALMFECMFEGSENESLLLLFKNAGADMDAADPRGETLLMDALGYGRSVEEILELIQLGANVNARNNEGLTPLFMINSCTSLEPKDIDTIVNALVAAGADMNAKNREGKTPRENIATAKSEPCMAG
jgi:ankyrin repeat protein